MPTFRPDAPVFFRAKVEISTRAIHFIAAHKSSLAVTGSHYLPLEVAVWSPVGRSLTGLMGNAGLHCAVSDPVAILLLQCVRERQTGKTEEKGR